MSASQFAAFQDATLAWALRFGDHFPLYRDITQPLLLAVHELLYGLALLAGSGALAGTPATNALSEAASRLMAFPQPPASLGLLERADIQLIATAVGAAAVSMLDSGAEQTQKLQVAAGATITMRLRLLVLSLQGALGLWKQLVQAGPAAAGVAKGSLLARLHEIFQTFVVIWEEVKDEEARREAEEAQLYKTKTRTSEVLSEEQVGCCHASSTHVPVCLLLVIALLWLKHVGFRPSSFLSSPYAGSGESIS
jgi:midasin